MIIRHSGMAASFAADEAMTITPLLTDESPGASLVIDGKVDATTASGHAQLASGDALFNATDEEIL